MICSRLASAVTISTGSFASFGFARTALSRSRPGIPGMFQSVIRKSKLPSRSRGSAVEPSSASVTLLKPSSLITPLTMRRMVAKSSTTRNFISEFTAKSSRLRPSRLLRVLPGGEPRPQANQGLSVQLAHPRLRHLQHDTDLLEIQFIRVVQRHHQLFAFREACNG